MQQDGDRKRVRQLRSIRGVVGEVSGARGRQMGRACVESGLKHCVGNGSTMERSRGGAASRWQ